MTRPAKLELNSDYSSHVSKYCSSNDLLLIWVAGWSSAASQIRNFNSWMINNFKIWRFTFCLAGGKPSTWIDWQDRSRWFSFSVLNPMILPGYQTSDSASSSEFSSLGLACLACGARVALGWLSVFKFCHPIVRSDHWLIPSQCCVSTQVYWSCLSRHSLLIII